MRWEGSIAKGGKKVEMMGGYIDPFCCDWALGSKRFPILVGFTSCTCATSTLAHEEYK